MPKVKTKLSSSTSSDTKIPTTQTNSNLLLNSNTRIDPSSTITMTTTTNNNPVDILLQDLGAEPLFASVQDQQSKNSFSNVSAQHAPVNQESMEAKDVFDSLMKRITPSSPAPSEQQSSLLNNNNIQSTTPNPISILNELHQRLRTGKLPKYEYLIEPTTGHFDCKLEIFGKVYRTNQPRVRKQHAKEDVALIALKDLVNENAHPGIADSVSRDVMNHFDPPDKNSIDENFMSKSEIWYRKQTIDHPEKKPRVILLEYCQMKRLASPDYRGRTDERGHYFFDCVIGDRTFSAEGVGFLKMADAKDCIAAKSFSILYKEFCEQERNQEKINRGVQDIYPSKNIRAILPSPDSLPTTSGMNPKRTLTINNSNNQVISNNSIGLNLSSTANDISTADLVLPSLNDKELQYKKDSQDFSRIQSLAASLLSLNSEHSLIPTMSSTNSEQSFLPKISSNNTDRSRILPSSSTEQSLIPTMLSTNTDRSLIPTMLSTNTDRSLISTMLSTSTDRSLVPTMSSTSTDRSLIPTMSSTSTDRSLIPTMSSTNTDRSLILPSSSSQISNNGFHPYRALNSQTQRFPHHQSSSTPNIPIRIDSQAKRFTSLIHEKAQAKRWDRPNFDFINAIGGFICRITINNLSFTGKVCAKKADAKEDAAEIAFSYLVRNGM